MSYLAEQNVIGSLLIDRNCVDKVYNELEPEMFTSELLGRLYIEFQRGYDNGYTVTVPLLIQKLADAEFPEYIVREEIKNCASGAITSTTVENYAKVIVSDYKAQRFGKLLGMIKVSPSAIEEQIGTLINDLEALREGRRSASKSLPNLVKENKDQYFRDNEAIKTYLDFPRLDELLGGLEGGDVIIIGARPAVGKSAFVTQIISNLAAKGKRIGFYNLEMQEKQVYERFVSSQSGISLTRLRRAVQFLGDEKERFNCANEELNIPIIALSQLNRVSEMKDTREPTMAELREAGDIEQDASVIILMWNLSQDDGSKKGCKIEKQRQGQTGKVVLNFNGDLMRFEETVESVKEVQEWVKVSEDDCPFK